METEQSTSRKKTYLEAALTPPMITPNSSPSNPYTIKNDIKVGIIDTRLKWYTNQINDEEICSVCKKGILEDEWNSYYNVYVMRYKDFKGDYKVKVFNDRDNHDNNIYCDKCKKEEIEKSKKVTVPSLVLE